MAPVAGKLMVMSAQLLGRVGGPVLASISTALAWGGACIALLKFYRGLQATYWIVRILRASARDAEEQARVAVVRLRLCVGPQGVAGGPAAAIALLAEHGQRQVKLGIALLALSLAMSVIPLG